MKKLDQMFDTQQFAEAFAAAIEKADSALQICRAETSAGSASKAVPVGAEVSQKSGRKAVCDVDADPPARSQPSLPRVIILSGRLRDSN